MKKTILIAISTFIAGILLSAVVVYAAAPKAMLIESESKYNFEESVQIFEESIKENGWKLPTVHDLKETMDKFGYDVKQVKVFELCHPDLAGAILQENDERIVSSLMPCRVAIYEKDDGKVYISRMNTSLLAGMMGGLIKDVMADASGESEVMLQSILAD